MAFTIPDANGLAQELVDRFGEERLRLSDTLERKLGNMEIKETEVFLDGKKIGDVRVNFYMGGLDKDIRMVSMVSYKGIIPGYVNPSNKTEQISISAQEYPTSPNINHLSFTQNNTPERPLHRTDGHQSIRLADHEVDGRNKNMDRYNPKPDPSLFE